MHQIIYRLPILDWPIYGYGLMLFMAYFFCTWLASWIGKKTENVPPQRMYDLAIWIFVCGIIGARITFMVQYRDKIDFTFWNFVALWSGGLVFYGSAIGGFVGYLGAYYFFFRKYKVSHWKMADILAPSAALGLCLGRIGCLLNGCCYGNVACPGCPAICFPLPTDARFELVESGFQTAAGFTMADSIDRVARVEPGSPAALAGLRDGDEVLEINNKKADLRTYLGNRSAWPRGENELALKVKHADGKVEEIAFVPWTIGLHPTQIYESVSMAILFLLLLAFFPYRRHAGEVMVLFMLCYATHRFLNEILRNDTKPVMFDMTLSQNISIAVFICGVLMGAWLWLMTPRIDTAMSSAAPTRV